MEKTTNKNITINNTNDFIKIESGKNFTSFKSWNSSKAVKIASTDIFNNFEIVASSSNDIDFAISCKIKTADFSRLNTLQDIVIAKNIRCNVNVFSEFYTADFLKVLSTLDINTQKHLLSKAICYNLKLTKGLSNTIKYYKDNNIKPTATDIIVKQKLSIYQVLKDFAFCVIAYNNSKK